MLYLLCILLYIYLYKSIVDFVFKMDAVFALMCVCACMYVYICLKQPAQPGLIYLHTYINVIRNEMWYMIFIVRFYFLRAPFEHTQEEFVYPQH